MESTYSLDIGIESVADHRGFCGHVTGDGVETFTPGSGMTGRLRTACSCGWVSQDTWNNDTTEAGGKPSKTLTLTIEAKWIGHIYRDVVPGDRREKFNRLNQLLRRLGAHGDDSEVVLGDISRDLTDATNVLAYLTTTGHPDWRDRPGAMTTPGSRARSAAADVAALTKITDLTPEQAFQVVAAAAQLLDHLPEVLSRAGADVERHRGHLYQMQGRTVDLDEVSYRISRADARLDQAAEHVHRAANALNDVHLKDYGDEY